MKKEKKKYARFFMRREYSIPSLSDLSALIKLQSEHKWVDQNIVHQLKEDGLSDPEIIRLFYF